MSPLQKEHLVNIKGETLRSGADFLEGAGKTLEPGLSAVSNTLGRVGDELAHGPGRKARVVEFKEASFENADDWTAAEDGATTVHASVSAGGTTVDLPEPVEFIHFGRVHLDRSHLLPSDKLNDTKEGALTVPATQKGGSPRELPAHGLYFRAALMRETVLLGGFIRAQMDALLQEERSKGVVGVLATVLADLTGSAGGVEDKPNAVDLNPHLKKVIKAGQSINVAKLDYPTLHAAGIELHTARKAYREYLVSEDEKRHAPAKTPHPGTGGILNEQVPKVNKMLSEGDQWLHKGAKLGDAVPKLTSIVPPSVQQFLSVVQKVSFKAWDVYASLIYNYAIRLEPIIEDSCRRMTVDAMMKKSTPVFQVWYLKAQEFPQLPADIEQQIFDKVDHPVPKTALPSFLGGVVDAVNQAAGVVTKPVHDALTKYDQQVGIDKTLDFLSRPDAYTPGRPFLDDIFLIPTDPDPPDLPEGERRARTGWSGGLGQMAVDSMDAALGVELPGFLRWIVAKVSTVSAEFIRGVYCKILTLKDTDVITEAEIFEAAEKHLVGNIIESILGGLKFVENLRKSTLDFPIGHVTLSVDALVGRAKEFAKEKLDSFVAPVIRFAMRDLYESIFAYRQTAIQNRALTMEVHLAQLPILFARLFRNTFFPLWDKVLEKTLQSITQSLMPKVADAAQKILHARDEVDMVRGKMKKAMAALDTLPKHLPDVGFDIMHPKQSVDQLKKDWNPIVQNAKNAYDETDMEVTHDISVRDQLETAFPLKDRIIEAEIVAVTDAQLKTVKPNLKWKLKKKKLDVGADAKKDAADKTGEKNAKPGQSDKPKAYDKPSFLAQQPTMSGSTFSSSPDSGIFPYSGTPYSGPASSHSGALASGLPTNHPLGSSTNHETTQVLNVSPELHKLANLNPEETVDLPSSALSGLPPFLGPKKA